MKQVGYLEYNGVVFGGSSQVTLSSQMVRDDADRTTIYVNNIITVRGVVYDQNDTGGDFTNLRDKLSQQGGTFRWSGQGAGAWDVNNGMLTDVKWGPKPKILSWAPIGSTRACEVEWQCEMCLPSNPNLYGSYSRLLAFNYGVSYSIDMRGCTKRSISGYLEIPLTRAGAGEARNRRSVPDTADSYRHLVNPALPDEFRRTQQQFTLSPDKSRLTFSIEDEELPSDNPFPYGVVDINCRHNVSWTRSARQGGFLRNRLTCDIMLGFNQPTANAYAIFLRIARERINIASSTKNIILEECSCEEGLFDRSSSFSVSWRFTSDVSTIFSQAMLTSTGLFSPLVCVPTWSQWAYSVSPNIGPGGYQNLRMSSTGDSITDLDGTVASNTGSFTSNPAGAGTISAELGLSNSIPNTSQSWLEYSAWAEIVEENPVTRQSILQAPSTTTATNNQTGSDPPLFEVPAGTSNDDIFQMYGNPRCWAIVRGHAKRAGYPIGKPHYATVGSAATTTIETCRFVQKIDGVWLGVKVYSAAWYIVYGLNKAPGVVTSLPDLREGVTA